jgi:Cation transporter/ATPase, N-terminus
MEPNTNKPNDSPGSKSLPSAEAGKKMEAPPDGRSEAEAHEQLTEDGPNEIKGKKNNPFQKVINSIWGPIRG